jgi:hypothetical protein
MPYRVVIAEPVYVAEVAALLATVLLGVAAGSGGAPLVVAAELAGVAALADVEVAGSPADGSPEAVVVTAPWVL